jgi:parvulin-like peptidyl-prolyl isomerase
MFEKPKSRTIVAWVACLMVAGAIAVRLQAQSAAPRTEIIEQVLVKVNGDIFTKTQLETQQVSALRQLGKLDQRPSDAQLRELLNEVTPQILVNAVDEMLLVQRGKELGLRLTDEQFKTAVDNIRKDNKIETEEMFQAALKQENMTLADLRTALERQMMAGQVRRNEVDARLSVTDEETRRFYDAHVTEFTTPSAVTLREVLVTIGAAGEEEARKKAEDIRRRATAAGAPASGAPAGEAFEKLASELSDSPSKANAGLVGPISIQDLSTDIRSAVESLKPGDVTPVLKTAAGFQVFKLESIAPKQTIPYEQARDQLSERVFTQKRRDEFQKYLEKLRTQAIIQWKSPDLQKAYEEGLKLAIPPDV